MKMSECAKRGCSYYWQDENESYPRCHFERMRSEEHTSELQSR